MLRDRLSALVSSAVDRLVESGKLPAEVREVAVEISDTKQPEHGDYACNFAMVAAKRAGLNPRVLGELLAGALLPAEGIWVFGYWGIENPLAGVEVAGPGFLNLRLKPEAISSCVPEVLALGPDFPKTQRPTPNAVQHLNVEFVSVNPNGPITIGSGRGAAYGSTLCNVLEAAGNTVHREYYINDGVNSEQMRQFAESVRAIVRGEPVPDKGYKGDYVVEVAERLKNEDASGTLADQPLNAFQDLSQAQMLAKQNLDLAAFGVIYDTWFSEQSLHDAGTVANCVDGLIANHAADTEPYRLKLKLARGGVIEDVERESQTATMEVEDDLTGTADTPVGKASKAAPTDETAAEPPSPAPSSSSAQSSPQEEGVQTLWLRSTKFGDDMDRVLKRKDGRLTYIASDVAYHKDKFNRGSKPDADGSVQKADKLITILGPDHHGYIGRLTAVVAAALAEEPKSTNTGEPLSEIEAKIYRSPEERDADQVALATAKQKLEVQIYQLVRFVKDGKPAPMRKRDGNIYAIIDLINEIGAMVKPNGTEEEKQTAGRDVARFFYLMRSHDTTFDFDLDLAAKQSDENPVFYVQYAHARIASVLRKAEEVLSVEGKDDAPSAFNTQHSTLNTGVLSHARELALIKKILDLPWEVQRAAQDYGVHRLTTYAIELARAYHFFYDACRVIQPEEPELTQARLALCRATQVALKGALDLLGISAPERMDRNEPALPA